MNEIVVSSDGTSVCNSLVRDHCLKSLVGGAEITNSNKAGKREECMPMETLHEVLEF